MDLFELMRISVYLGGQVEATPLGNRRGAGHADSWDCDAAEAFKKTVTLLLH